MTTGGDGGLVVATLDLGVMAAALDVALVLGETFATGADNDVIAGDDTMGSLAGACCALACLGL